MPLQGVLEKLYASLLATNWLTESDMKQEKDIVIAIQISILFGSIGCTIDILDKER